MQLVTLVAVIVSDQHNQHCTQKTWRVGSGVKGGGEEVSTMITARNKLINNLFYDGWKLFCNASVKLVI